MNQHRVGLALLLNHTNNSLRDAFEQITLLNQWNAENCTTNEELCQSRVQIFSNIEHIRMPRYDLWINEYLNYDFFCIFRMTRETFHQLLAKLSVSEHDFTGGFLPIRIEKQVLMTLWWLGKGEVLLTIADRFNVTVSTVYKSTSFVLSRLINLQYQYIVWPNINEVATVAAEFHEKAGYPGVIGAIDVCNVPFKAPADQQASYIDRKMQHSIKLQAVCTSDRLFTNILVGFPGSVHDSRVLRNSNLFSEVQVNGNKQQYFFNEDYHIVGDSAYPLCNWLMTPYRDNGHLTVVQRRHNSIHSATRVAIENSFGILKARWRILRYINVNSVVKAVRVITACCILHNFCYVNHDFWKNREDCDHGDCDEEGLDNNINDNGSEKRNYIANLLTQQ